MQFLYEPPAKSLDVVEQDPRYGSAGSGTLAATRSLVDMQLAAAALAALPTASHDGALGILRSLATTPVR